MNISITGFWSQRRIQLVWKLTSVFMVLALALPVNVFILPVIAHAIECDDEIDDCAEENIPSGTLRVVKFNDENNSGEWDDDEAFLSRWQFCVYETQFINEDGGYWTTEDQIGDCQETDGNGEATWSDVEEGDYKVVESQDSEDGWVATTDSEQVVSVQEDEESVLYFGNRELLGTVRVFKYNDENGSEEYDDGEKFLSGWEICLYEDSDEGLELIGCQPTDGNGRAEWNDLGVSRYYRVGEEERDDWENTSDNNPEDLYLSEESYEQEVWFGNQSQPASVRVFKFFDLDQDGEQDTWWNEEGGFWYQWGEEGGFFGEGSGMWWDKENGPGGYWGEEGGWFNEEGSWYFEDEDQENTYGRWMPGTEPGMAGWQMCVYEVAWFGEKGGGFYAPSEKPLTCGTTDATGWIELSEIPPGEYYLVEETREGWGATTEGEWNGTIQYIEIERGDENTIYFGNWNEDRILPRSKFELPENGSSRNVAVRIEGTSSDNNGTIPIEIVELQLRSAEPIIVNRNWSEGFQIDFFFDVLPLQIRLPQEAFISENFKTRFQTPKPGQIDSFFDVFVEVQREEQRLDSFFDIFVEVRDPETDSFFDITYRIDPPAVDSFFDIFIEPQHVTKEPQYTLDSFFDITYDIDLGGRKGECSPILTPGLFFGHAFLPNNCNNLPFNWSFLLTPVDDNREPKEGVYKLIAHAFDKSGNRENTSTVTFTYDITPPEGEWPEDTEGSSVSRFVSLKLSEVSDNLSSIASVLFQYRRAESNNEYSDIGTDTDSDSGWGVVWDTRGLELGDYEMRATIIDAAGNQGTASTVVTVEEVITNESLGEANSTSLTISWTTPRPATSRVVYDTVSHSDNELGNPPNFGYAFSTSETDTDPKVTNHSVTITGLNSNTTYYYRTISRSSPETLSDEGNSKTNGGHSCPEGSVFDGATCVSTAPPSASPSSSQNDSLAGSPSIGSSSTPPPPIPTPTEGSVNDSTGGAAPQGQSELPLPTSFPQETTPPPISLALTGSEASVGGNDEEDTNEKSQPQVAGAQTLETLENTFAFPQMLPDPGLPLTDGALLAFVLASGFNPWLLLGVLLLLLFVYLLQHKATRHGSAGSWIK